MHTFLSVPGNEINNLVDNLLGYVNELDIDECASKDNVCGVGAICENAVPGYNCLCPQGYTAKPDPKIACEQVNVFVRVSFGYKMTSMACGVVRCLTISWNSRRLMSLRSVIQNSIASTTQSVLRDNASVLMGLKRTDLLVLM